MFIQPIQKRRSIRHKKEQENEKNFEGKLPVISTKLIDVFPTTSDELDPEEIEHAASSLVDEDSLDFLFGPSKIIPNLVLHENIDFSHLIDGPTAVTVFNEEEGTVVIEPIIIEFKIDEAIIHENDTFKNVILNE